MMAGLDRSKPFATVFGDDQGRIYEQGGQYFRGDGSLWTDAAPAKGEAAAAKAPASKRAAIKPEPAVPATPAGEQDAQLAAQLGGAA